MTDGREIVEEVKRLYAYGSHTTQDQVWHPTELAFWKRIQLRSMQSYISDASLSIVHLRKPRSKSLGLHASRMRIYLREIQPQD
jgi:hypothetical protein